MERNADDRRFAEPWHPMTDTVALKHLGKTAEECGELVSAIARCIIQGIDEREPVTGKSNREWLEDEIADLTAGMQLLSQHFALDYERMANRTLAKMTKLSYWHANA